MWGGLPTRNGVPFHHGRSGDPRYAVYSARSAVMPVIIPGIGPEWSGRKSLDGVRTSSLGADHESAGWSAAGHGVERRNVQTDARSDPGTDICATSRKVPSNFSQPMFSVSEQWDCGSVRSSVLRDEFPACQRHLVLASILFPARARPPLTWSSDRRYTGPVARR